MPEFYRIRNWSKYQHYKDRNPPWIKLHVEIMSSADWVMLDDASKLLAIVCMMVASKHDGQVPGDAAYLKRVAYLTHNPSLKPLIACGFLEPLADASKVLADARPETETEAETETEKKAHAKRAVVPLPDWIDREAWGAFMEMRRSKRAPATPRAVQGLIKRLDGFRHAGHDPTAILDASTVSGWTNVYEPKGYKNGTNQKTGHAAFELAATDVIRELAEHRRTRMASGAENPSAPALGASLLQFRDDG